MRENRRIARDRDCDLETCDSMNLLIEMGGPSRGPITQVSFATPDPLTLPYLEHAIAWLQITNRSASLPRDFHHRNGGEEKIGIAHLQTVTLVHISVNRNRTLTRP